MTKAKLFTTGGSQAVRLPAEFRFEGDEVDIRRDSVTGDVVLSKPIASWDEYFDWVRTLDLPDDVLRAISRRTTCATCCRSAGVAEFLLDTEAASRLMRAERGAITSLRRSGAKSVSISSITMAELLYGARLREDNPSVMAAVRAFLARISVHPWDEEAAEAHARIRVGASRRGRAGAFDIMIAAHAEALGMTLVTSDAAVKNLKIDGLKIVSW